MFNPVATYRLQFHKAFTFQDFQKIIPYLKSLGVSTIYASPIFQSVAGSTHGYDTLDPLVINKEIGTEKELSQLGKDLSKQGIRWLQDIVPNHMAFDTGNPWLADVLEKGKRSAYAEFFDIDWNSTSNAGKIMVPFLGSSLEEVIEKGELKLAVSNSKLCLKYHEALYPVNHFAYEAVLKNLNAGDFSKVYNEALAIPDTEEEYAAAFDDFIKSFAQLFSEEENKIIFERNLANINENIHTLTQIIQQQYYLLCHWQQTDTQINYRRFFTVNGLISLNMQHENVFDHFHVLIKQLIEQEVFHGLRVDHIDGLFDPTTYLQRLRNLAGDQVYITVEKILQPEEKLPDSWNIEGNTGYDFLAMVNNLLTNKSQLPRLKAFYQNLTASNALFAEQIRDKKRKILYCNMIGDLENLYRLFLSLNLLEESKLKNVRAEDLKKTIGEFLVYCPVYRYYANKLPLEAEEGKAVENVLNEIRTTIPELAAPVKILSFVFFNLSDKAQKERALYFYQRCMQFSGPLMAKGFEDTLMYSFNNFIAHNEVGDSPAAPGYYIREFHEIMKQRQQLWPLSINTTATHDTKRGEDVRARLNVISDVADEWVRNVSEWMMLTKKLNEENLPDKNDRYFIFQTIVGHYPMPGENVDDFKSRLAEYLQKALREAKVHSSWAQSNEEYENAAKNFALAILDENKPFWKTVQSFQSSIVDFGIINSLIQVLLKFTCPGVPDVYQGTELWDLSFVDPDNRRKVDYERRSNYLERVMGSKTGKDFIATLWQDRYTGKIKLWLTHHLLHLRKELLPVFTDGEYIPLEVKGRFKENIIAFARREQEDVLIVAAPLHLAELCQAQKKDWKQFDWQNTKIVLPRELTKAKNVFTSETLSLHTEVEAKDLFRELPFAVFKGILPSNERGAGILLHISSLPSSFGIGDLGPQAKAFADVLHRTHQKYWQLLPLNPTEAGQAHSPYSATSSSAGNVLFISPELLAQDGFLDTEDLEENYLPVGDTINFNEAEAVKKALLDKAWENFKQRKETTWQDAFDDFCLKEKNWLDDFALYTLLKKQYGGKPWYEWPEEIKSRKNNALKDLEKKFADEFLKYKWFQFLFTRQWNNLKRYCNTRRIKLVGDIPFYVSYDSADVWTTREIFKLDTNGNPIGVAGVPPDAFSDDGQLWGMPVFRWDVLKKTNYAWWMERLKKNLELFDIVRLDHFRAFSAYWEVPSKETTAKNGKWKKGPGAHFFNHAKKIFGDLPFIAEDLGEIDEPVYELRDRFGLPGMKVLQFAFGEDMASSIHIPHNYEQNFFVYPGTHDNNTVLGWWKKEAEKDRVEEYAGEKIRDAQIATLLCRMAHASVANVAILPIQDLLGLDEDARMNLPSSGQNNWHWRLLPGQLNDEAEKNLRTWTQTYYRT